MAETEKQKVVIDSSSAEKAVRETDVSEILEKYDKESAFRVLDGGWALIIKIIAISFSLFQLYTAAFGTFPTQIQRVTHLGFTLCLAFLLYPATRKKERTIAETIFLAALGIVSFAYVIINYDAITLLADRSSSSDFILAAVVLGFIFGPAYLFYPTSWKRERTAIEDIILAALGVGGFVYVVFNHEAIMALADSFGISGFVHATIVLGFALCLAFLLYPTVRKSSRNRMAVGDVFLAALATWVCAYVIVEYHTIVVVLAGRSRLQDLVHSALVIILVLEVTRRVVGLPLAIIAVCFIAYAKLGPLIPGLLGHRGFLWRRVLHHLYMTDQGILGVPIGVSTEFVFLFILFGAFLQRSGLGKLFIDLALAFTGHHSGGPAKVAVVSSCLFGTICGSSVANAVTTGPFTIPMMKSIGYKSEFAAAVEASASAGGQILPPIMGAAAFVMAEMIGVPYLTIAKAATLPAMLYFVAIFVMVHLEAKRLKLEGIPKDQLPCAKKTLLYGGHLLTPIVVIVYMLLQGFTPSMAALYGIVSTVIVAIAHSAILLTIKIAKEGNFVQNVTNFVVEWTKIIIESLENGARSAVGVAAACACAGIIIGIVALTGAGLKIANEIVSLAGGQLFLTLVFTMIASILLGLGLPTTAKYIILAAMAAPAINQFELSEGVRISMLAAHMFILYFGVFADITPPVALVTYATAGIAKADATKASLIALKLAAVGFIVPYLFIYSPELLLINATWINVPKALISTLLGIFALGFAASGYWLRHLNVFERALLFAGAVALIFPGLATDLTGAALLFTVYLTQKKWPEAALS